MTLIIGLILGAAGIWIAAHYTHVPGIDQQYNGSSVTGGANSLGQLNGNNNGNNQNNNQNNQTTSSTQNLVSGFPNNVPIYQPSDLLLSTKSTRGGKAVVYSASYTSNDQASAIASYYQQQLASGGWHITQQNQSGGVTTIQASGNNEQVNVLISSLGEQAGADETANTGFQLAVTPNS